MITYSVSYKPYATSRTKTIQVQAIDEHDAIDKAVSSLLIDFAQITDAQEVLK